MSEWLGCMSKTGREKEKKSFVSVCACGFFNVLLRHTFLYIYSLIIKFRFYNDERANSLVCQRRERRCWENGPIVQLSALVEEVRWKKNHKKRSKMSIKNKTSCLCYSFLHYTSTRLILLLDLYEVCSYNGHIELSVYIIKWITNRVVVSKRLTIRCIHLILSFFFFLYTRHNIMKRKKNGTQKGTNLHAHLISKAIH